MQGNREGGLLTDLMISLAVLYLCFASRLRLIDSKVGERFSREVPAPQVVELFSVGLALTSERSLLMSWSAGTLAGNIAGRLSVLTLEPDG